MLSEVYKSFKKLADQIEWQKMNVNDLFRECIAHEKEDDYEVYFSALVCRFFGYAGRVYLQCNKHVPFDQCYDCIIDALRYVLAKRVWEDPNSSLYGDNSAPDKAMHIAIKRQRSIMLSLLNADKRQSNFNTLSIDEAKEDYKDSTEGMLFDIDTSEDSCVHLIASYFNSDDYLNGLMLDSVCYCTDPTNIYKSALDRLKDVRLEYFDYYKDAYDIDLDKFKKSIHEIRKMSNKLLMVKLKQLLYQLRLVYNS